MPPGVVTITSITPTEPEGEVADICVVELTVTPVAALLPNITDVAPVRLVPVMVTEVPPVVRPLVGEIPVMVGICHNNLG